MGMKGGNEPEMALDTKSLFSPEAPPHATHRPGHDAEAMARADTASRVKMFWGRKILSALGLAPLTVFIAITLSAAYKMSVVVINDNEAGNNYYYH